MESDNTTNRKNDNTDVAKIANNTEEHYLPYTGEIDYNIYSTIINDIYVKSRQQALVDIDNAYNNNDGSINSNVIKPRMLALKSGLHYHHYQYQYQHHYQYHY